MTELAVRSLRFGQRGPYDFCIPGGECLGLQGPSGVGKTLLLRAIADLDPHRGQVRLGHLDCAAIPAPAWRKKVGLLTAESRWWHDRVGDHFRELDTADLHALRQLGFDESVLDWQVNRLSTGEKQRLALIRLLQNRPEALLLDEPTANLYRTDARQVETLLAGIRREHGVAMLWVSHDPEQLQRVASRIMIMQPDGSLTMVSGE